MEYQCRLFDFVIESLLHGVKAKTSHSTQIIVYVISGITVESYFLAIVTPVHSISGLGLYGAI